MVKLHSLIPNRVLLFYLATGLALHLSFFFIPDNLPNEFSNYYLLYLGYVEGAFELINLVLLVSSMLCVFFYPKIKIHSITIYLLTIACIYPWIFWFYLLSSLK